MLHIWSSMRSLKKCVCLLATSVLQGLQMDFLHNMNSQMFSKTTRQKNQQEIQDRSCEINLLTNKNYRKCRNKQIQKKELIGYIFYLYYCVEICESKIPIYYLLINGKNPI